MTSIADRFHGKYVAGSLSECWIWRGAVRTDGYGLIKVEGKMVAAHRLALELSGVAVPSDIYVCHHCDVPLCVNPSHLFLGTNSQNQLDSSAKRRHHNTRKQACKHGHSLDARNTRILADGRRACRKCNALSVGRYKARQKRLGVGVMS